MKASDLTALQPPPKHYSKDEMRQFGLLQALAAGVSNIDVVPIFTPADFTDLTGQAASTAITSGSAVVVSGINYPATVTVSGGSYRVGNSGSFVSTPGTITNGQPLWAQVTTGIAGSGAATVTITVGGTPITFSATPVAGGSVDITISNALDDGTWNQFLGTFTTSGNMTAQTTGPGYDIFACVSFPGVTIANASTISTATIDFEVVTGVGAETLTINFETPAASPGRWTAVHNPDGSTSIANVASISSTAGAKSVDVKTALQAVINHANWESGDPLNIWFVVVGGGALKAIGGVGTGGTGAKARLQVTYV